MTVPNFYLSVRRALGLTEHKEPFGHLTSLQIGTTNILAADIEVVTPFDGSTLNIVGPLTSIDWVGGVGDPIELSAQLSQQNALTVKALLLQTQIPERFTASFVVYQYDEEMKTHFVACQGAADGKTLSGRLNSRRLAVAEEGMLPVPGADFSLFEMAAELQPGDTGQNIMLAVSPEKRYVKRWGLDIKKETVPEDMASTTA